MAYLSNHIRYDKITLFLCRTEFRSKTLKSCMKDNGDLGKRISYLKIDIENSEFSCLKQWLKSNVLTFVDQLGNHFNFYCCSSDCSYRKLQNKSRGLSFFFAIFFAAYIRGRLINEGGLYSADFNFYLVSRNTKATISIKDTDEIFFLTIFWCPWVYPFMNIWSLTVVFSFIF